MPWVFLCLSLSIAAGCSPPSREVNTAAEFYYCRGEQVSAETYASLEPQGGCSRSVRPISVCVCPADTFGETCQSMRPIVCNLTIVEPTQCDDPQDYNPQLPGIPTCFSVSTGSTISLSVLVRCYTVNPGVSIANRPMYVNLDEESVYANSNFAYAYNRSGLILSNATTAFLDLTFLDFRAPQNLSFRYQTLVDMDQLAGERTVQVASAISDEIRQHASVSGRLHFELNLHPSSTAPIYSRGLVQAADLADYSEPERTQKAPVGMIVGVVVGVLA